MFLKKIFLVLITVYGQLHSYQDIASFHELYSYIQPGDMIVTDIDNTVMVPHVYKGSDMWFVACMEDEMSTGKNRSQALDVVLPEYARLQKLITVRAVEPMIPDLIQNWQRSGHVLIGLTNRGGIVIQDTCALVATLGIDFSVTAPQDSFGGSFSVAGNIVEYTSGIIFCATADKGKSLVQFLRLTGIPKKIIFIDDTLAKVISVQKALTELQAELPAFEFHCFHYTHLHEYIASCQKK